MMKAISTILPSVVAILFLGGCGTLPSSYDVEKKFSLEHPGYTIEKVEYEIRGERGYGPGRDEAVFRVYYKAPGDKEGKIVERRFRKGQHGWIEQTPR